MWCLKTETKILQNKIKMQIFSSLIVFSELFSQNTTLLMCIIILQIQRVFSLYEVLGKLFALKLMPKV